MYNVESDLLKSELTNSMSAKLSAANVVIVARNFNPSVVSQIWLVDNSIISRDEFLPGCLFSDALVNVETEGFQLLATPEQLQFTPKVPLEEQQALIKERVGRVVSILPHTPYVAMGLNFTWHIRPEGDFSQFSRKYFCSSPPMANEFDGQEDARFGAYFSKEAYGGRLKLDVKPVTAISKNEGETIEVMQFAFNLHFDVEPSATVADDILGNLNRWDVLRQYSTQLIQGEEA